MWNKLVLLITVFLAFSGVAQAVEVYHEGETSLDLAFWGQAWYQWVEDGRDTNNDGAQDEDLNDFMFRRAYFTISGTATNQLGFFVHYAGDRIGQDGLDSPGVALGSGLALRDGWVTLKLAGDDAMLQMGRMYVPLTRNYGTTSTKTLLTTDLDWTQGGVRGSIFYPSKVGRDDGACVWGNVLQDRLQYRLMTAEGEEGAATNPEDNLRYTGRVSYAFLDPETGWFNQGTYLGKKHVLSAGLGIDAQEDLVLAGSKQDYTAWTVDLFYDRPLAGEGGVTMEAAYIQIDNGPNAINYTRMSQGDDASIISAKAGYLLPGQVGIGRLQPVVHYEYLNVDDEDDTSIYGAGVNYFLKGHPNKLTLDMTYVDQEEESFNPAVQDHMLITLQFAAGF